MATYPSYTYSLNDSEVSRVEKIVIDEWPNGSVRGRDYSDSTRYRYQLVHPLLNDSEKATLETFFIANKTLPFNFVDKFVTPNVTRTGLVFESFEMKKLFRNAWKVSVKMRMR